MFVLKRRNPHGQAVVEFALILVVLLLFVFIIIESGRLYQGYVTIQNSARAAGRYAITGRADPACLSETPACVDARLESIKRVGRSEATGLVVDPNAVVGNPESLDVQVFSKVDNNANWIPDYAGTSGKPILVRVTYRMPIITPLLRAIVQSVRLSTQVILNNEDFDQTSSTNVNNDPPDITGGGDDSGPSNADVELAMDASSPIVALNEAFDYTIDVTNNGPFFADNVVLDDILPSGVTFLDGTVSPGGNTCSESGGTVTCQLPNLGNTSPSDAASVILNVQAPAVAGDIVNTASVAIGTGAIDPNLSNNTDSVTVSVVNDNEADIEVVSKIDTPDPVTVDENLTYTILVRNNGLSDATGVTLVDNLPPNIGGYVSATPSVGDCEKDAFVVTCYLGNMPTGATATVVIVVTAPDNPTTLTNTATASANEVDPVPGNNSASAVTTVVPPQADIFVTKTDSPDPVALNGDLIYALTVGNNGPANAIGVQLVDSLPASVAFQSVSSSQGTCNVSGGAVNCDLGTINVSGLATVLITVKPTQQGTISNNASVSLGGGITDSNMSNNTSTAVTTVLSSADLMVTVTDSPDPIVQGSTLTYVVIVTNSGPGQAANVQMVDNLPANSAFLSYTTTKGVCSVVGSTVTCNLGNLTPGLSVTISIDVIATVEGIVQNQATVSSTTADPATTNNSATTSTTVLQNTTRIITVQPNCGPGGLDVTVTGYDWETNGNFDLQIDLIPSSGSPVVNLYTSPGSFAQQNWIRDVTIPVSAANDFYIIEAHRHPSQVATATFKVPCPSPNLTVSIPQLVSPPAVAGEPTTFLVNVTNNGEVDVVGQFFVGLYFDPSPAPTIGVSTYISQSFRVKLMAVNGLALSQTKPLVMRVNQGFPSPGGHAVYAVVDVLPEPTGDVFELIETDNIAGHNYNVDPNPSPSPTPTVTLTPSVTPPGPTPTPTVTPVPGALTGQAFLVTPGGQSLPQAGVEVNLYFDDAGGVLVGTDFSAANGSYSFMGLTPGNYTVTGCIDIEGQEYFYAVSAVLVPSGVTTIQDLFLIAGFCS